MICGHIHHPEIKEISNKDGAIQYLNSGDWVENLTALEYNNGKWSIYRFDENEIEKMKVEEPFIEDELNNNELFNNLLNEFNLMKEAF
ncbi:MAG TPA: hypothetical protein VLS85_02555 [Hanamia sp.]|nr:hypothetical protein [Hanamia sp.]